MPKISLVVCLFQERDLLERLLQHAEGCYDDLVVVHDGVEEAVAEGDRRSEVGDRGSEIAQETTDNPGSRSASIPIINHPSSVISHHPSVINQQSAINNQQPSEARQTAAGSPQGELKANQFPSYEDGWKSPEELSLKEPDAPPIEIARDYAELPKDAPIPTGYRLKSGPPHPGSIHELVARYRGRFYEGPRCFQQEPHWPFAWWAAKHNWILRLDADEFPSGELRDWLRKFRDSGSSAAAGYRVIWPPWDGKRQVTTKAVPDRLFLLDSKQMSFFGMVEHTPESDELVERLGLLLEHQPKRKSFGLRNLLFRQQAYRWRKVISRSLLSSPQALPCWNYSVPDWPPGWKYRIQHPFACILKSFTINLARDVFGLIKRGIFPNPSLVFGTASHQALLALQIRLEKMSVK